VFGNCRSVVESDYYTRLIKLDVQEGKIDKLFANHMIQVCKAHTRLIVSFRVFQQVKRGARPTRGIERESGTMCTCEEIERGRHAYTASKLVPVKQWWTQNVKLGITIQEIPTSPKTNTFVVFYLFCHVSKNLSLNCLFYATMNMCSVSYVNAARDVVTVLLILAKYLSLYLHIFTCTYRGTHTQACIL